MSVNKSMLCVHAHLNFSLVSEVATPQKHGRQQNCAQHDRCHKSSVVLNKSRVSTCEQTMQNSMLDRVVGMVVLADLWISFGTLQAKEQIALSRAQQEIRSLTCVANVRRRSNLSKLRRATQIWRLWHSNDDRCDTDHR